ncbi:pLS20_p028 family conjugation system transmembrane protein [Bacillus proteolyticus]|uniref:pLS20_p028 family conjugation system transmembrane protein n=1 Tax=Bacillus proteolyticus TaxID=2026192 RepID=UPI0030F45D98
MKDEEILKVLEEFSDYLQVGDIVNYVFRWIGWFIIQGLSLIVDGLEGVTDAILGIKGFFNSPGVQEFVDMLYPLFVVLLAISFLYIGYMFIMNKQMNRSQIIINISVTLSVLCLLSTGMTKVDKFTDDAIAVVKSEQKGSLSDEIIKKNITDIAVLDQNGWKKKEDLNPKNHIPEKNIRQIDITEKIDKDFEFAKDKALSEGGQDILKNKIVMDGLGTASLAELKDGWFDFFPEKYYRWHWNFWNIFFTLLITGATLLLVSIKLARLFYELTFNYLLANILAPADVANGQKLKAVLSNILNIFVATIMIFLSLKLYIMGTEFLHDKLSGVPYLIALAAFSMAVLDGPAVVERLFGIDIGLKSSWGMLAGGLAGGFALGKGVGHLANSKPMKGLGNMIGKGAKGAAQGAGVAATKTANAAGGMAGIVGGLKKGNESGNKESLQDQMKKADQKKTQGNDVANNEKEKGNLNKEEDKKNGGNPSIQEDMKKEGNEKPEVASGQESGTTSLQDEMKEAGKVSGASEGNQAAGGVRQGASEGNPTVGGVKQGASQGSQTAGGASEGSPTVGGVRQGASEGSPTVGGVRQGASEGSPGPMETSRPVASGSSPGPVETSRPVTGGSSPAPVETSRSVTGGNSPAPADIVTVTHSSPSVPYESDKEVAAGSSHETRTLGQYATDTVKKGYSSTTSSVKQTVRGVQERINNSETVQNTKRLYQTGQNTGKSWRDIVNKNKKNTDKK